MPPAECRRENVDARHLAQNDLSESAGNRTEEQRSTAAQTKNSVANGEAKSGPEKCCSPRTAGSARALQRPRSFCTTMQIASRQQAKERQSQTTDAEHRKVAAIPSVVVVTGEQRSDGGSP